MKKVMSFYKDLAFVWGLLALVLVLINAHTTAKKTNVSHAYLQVFKQRSLDPLQHGNHYEQKYTEEDFLNKPKERHEKEPQIAIESSEK